QDGIVDIAPDGDVVLSIRHEAAASAGVSRFRVRSSILKQHSRYFAGLLDGRFGEAQRIAEALIELQNHYISPGDAPSTELPSISIIDVGRISAVKSIEPLCTDFLASLHGQDTQGLPPVANLANLAIVADRFDALESIAAYVRRRRFIRAIDGKMTPKTDGGLSEERVRQRVLIGALLDHSAWLEKYSMRMIYKGWVGRDDVDEATAMWWSLPRRLEDEISIRRDYILETIQSLQGYFVGLYTSRGRQCKLGYDSSAQCDSFQLGEMIRFLTRIGTLQVQGLVFDSADPPAPFAGDLHTLLDSLRQVPEYQIDRNHSHCGIRTRLMPLLDLIADNLQHVGICLACWAQDCTAYSWMETKRPLLWKRETHQLRGHGNKEMHVAVRELFTASDRYWS
ncbi:hypothetical protein DOTSEDRAFT_96863, partial [Dothistroma septosporum NZE10]